MDINNIKYNKQVVRRLVMDYQSKNKGETQFTIAERVGLSKSAMFYKNPTAESLAKMADFFKVDVNYFFDMPTVSFKEHDSEKRILKEPVPEYKSIKTSSDEGFYKTLYEQQLEIAKLKEELNKVLTELKK
ncbi:XRE family transcriptional regulator [Paludibacter sp. 221]|uniref:helix-turn-helix domain-containing protein n=1 Tax=Paludibacter sp. 221 TaxID=2302939 RepID=UPI0013D4A677|nr:helix-turn-helix transcriptional regulator [Paludibacter sp. 221]NDV47012.1 XRE family transcriptional regulator [Paludibacter sp. 221]